MTYVLMSVSCWKKDESGHSPDTQALADEFQLAVEDIDPDYGVIAVDENTYTVRVSVEAAKKMLAQHVDNTVAAASGPFVSGPYSSPRISQ